MQSPTATTLDRSPAHILTWAAYLACSWTWCIGMFLPIMLWRDFGPWGFIAFALPNIVGAAEMGFLLSKPGSSERFVDSHRNLCRVFSAVTIAFQVFFLVWMAGLFGAWWLLLLGVLAASWLALAFGDSGVTSSGWRGEAPMVLLVSITCTVWYLLRRGGLELAAAPATPAPPADLAGLALVCALGFVFCPYLDLTFHKARRSLAPGPGKAAFAIGFGVMFAAMIAFTAIYAKDLTDAVFGTTPRAYKYLLAPVAAHMAMQLLFTIGVHGSELRSGGGGAKGMNWPLVGGLLVAGGLGALAASDTSTAYAGLTLGELLYRAFMGFYGLVFPAYVWICASPIARTSPPTRQMLAVWVASMLVAAPFYWLGFIERDSWWLLVGVGIVIAARFVRGKRSEP